MVEFYAPQLLAVSDERLVDLYNSTHNLPRTETRKVIRSKCGIVLNGPFSSGVPARSAMLIGIRMPAGKVVLVKIPRSRKDAEQEYSVYETLWEGCTDTATPPHIAGRAEFLDTAFSSPGGTVQHSVVIREDPNTLKYALVLPKYEISLHQVPRPHDPEFALETGHQMKQALDYMHSKNLAHCDVKATNIFLDSSGMMLLCDALLLPSCA
eukprot:TRINITY_DN378_c1_g1_i8.p1 TRINITY_DN378_c1_g1~~TRINITY_DN378_c1_g1_i8.p1  ORF type:complete len:210 (+),score=15.50 TRINITY_DN378_c1_g1_i8:1697-2326(+)